MWGSSVTVDAPLEVLVELLSGERVSESGPSSCLLLSITVRFAIYYHVLQPREPSPEAMRSRLPDLGLPASKTVV